MANLTEMYFRVEASAEASGSNSNNQSLVYIFPPKRNSGSEFGSIFRDACSELKENSGTHQPKGYATSSELWAPTPMLRIPS